MLSAFSGSGTKFERVYDCQERDKGKRLEEAYILSRLFWKVL